MVVLTWNSSLAPEAEPGAVARQLVAVHVETLREDALAVAIGAEAFPDHDEIAIGAGQHCAMAGLSSLPVSVVLTVCSSPTGCAASGVGVMLTVTQLRL